MEKNKLDSSKHKKNKKGKGERPMTVEESPYWTEAKKREFIEKMSARKNKEDEERRKEKISTTKGKHGMRSLGVDGRRSTVEGWPPYETKLKPKFDKVERDQKQKRVIETSKRPSTVEESPYWTEARKKDFMEKMAAKNKKKNVGKEGDLDKIAEEKSELYSENQESGKNEVEEMLSEDDLKLRKKEGGPLEKIDPQEIVTRDEPEELVARKDGPVVPVTNQPSIPEGRKTVNVASADEIAKSYAWRLAEEKVREMLHEPEREMTSGSGMKSLLNNITASFRHPVRFAKKAYLRAAEQGYLYKFYREALEEITNNQNLMLEIETSYAMGRPVQINDPNLKREHHYEILDKVIEQYSNNIAELEEQGNGLFDQRANSAFQDLLSRHYLEGWDRQRFEQEQRGVINGLKDQGVITDQDFVGASGRSISEVQDGRMYASNLFQIAEEYRSHIESKINEISADRSLSPEQKKQIENHVRSTIKLNINLGAKLSDLHNKRPADTMSVIERRIAQLQRMPIIGKIASNPGTAAVIGALGGSFLGRGAVRGSAALGLTAAGVVAGAWIPVLSAGAAAGVYGAVRRNLELKKDRGMHQRQRILGNETSGYRRNRMDRFEYNVRSAGDMLQQLETIRNTGSFQQLNDGQKRELAEMFARFKVELQRDYDYRTNGGENRTVDLISATNKEEGEKYGTNLISKTDLKRELYQYLRQNGLIESERSSLGNNNEFNDLFNGEVLSLDQNIDQMDRQFDSYRKRSAATMGAIAGFSGALGTIAGQEITNWFREGSAYTAIDSLKDVFGSKGKINQIDSSLIFGGTGTRLNQGLNRIKVNGQTMEIFLNSDGKTIDVAQSHLPKDWKINSSGTGIIHETIDGYKSDHMAGKSLFIGDQEISSAPGAKEVVVGGEKIQVFVDQNGKIDPTQTSKLLPKGWRLSQNQSSLFHEIEGAANGKTYEKFSEFAKDLGYDNTQRVSYQGFKFQGTAPDKGVRAMPEVIANLKNNLKLHSNSTELMLQYRQDSNGDVIVDTSKILGKALRGGPNDSVESLKELLRQGKVSMALALDNNSAQDGSQFNPILLKMQEDGTIRIPKNLAEVFYGFDEKGKLLKNPGDHPGLHSLVFDTGMRRQRDGAMIVEEISATLGERPEMKITENVTEEFPINTLNFERIIPTPGEKTFENAAVQGGREFDYPWGVGPAGASRWQLEREGKQENNTEKGAADVPEGPMIEGRKRNPEITDGREIEENFREKTEDEIKNQQEQAGSSFEKEENEENREDNKTSEPNGAESEFVIDKDQGKQSWERLSNYFVGVENLEKISSNFKKVAARRVLLGRLLSLEEKEKDNGINISRTNGARQEFLNYFDSFKKLFPGLRISFAEFNHCLKRAFSDLAKFE